MLISTVLSLRTQDETTAVASRRLFARAADPAAMLKLRAATIAKLIYSRRLLPHQGARHPRHLPRAARALRRRRYRPTSMRSSRLNGVGRKTANLVLTLGFRAQGICVDTHVHRITNRWGYVRTKAPNDTEQALRKILPPQHWIEINDILVAFGQRLCRPISPHRSRCPIVAYCPRRGVTSSR